MTLQTDTQALADTLRPIDPGAAARLESLGLALSPDGEASGWAGVSVFEALDPAGVAQDIRNTTLSDLNLARRERLRNLLALLPVPLTWLGLMYAAIGYSAAISAQPSLLTRPLLLLWEQGFDGLAPFPWSVLGFLTFSHVAVGDVVVLLLVLLLTWQIHTEVNVRQAARERTARDVERGLRQIAWSAALVLASRTSPRANDDRSRQVLESLLDELRAERERGTQLANQREREAADLRTFGSEFRVGAQDLRRVTGEVRETFDAMLNVTAHLEDRIADLSRDESEVREGISQLTGGLDRYYEFQRSATAEMMAGSRGLAEAAERALASGEVEATALQGLGAALASLREQGELAAETQLESARLSQQTLVQSNAVMTELQHASAELNRVVAALREVGPSMLAAAEHQSASATEIAAAIDLLVRDHSSTSWSMAQAAQRISLAATDLSDGVRDLTEQLGGPGRSGQNGKRRFWIFGPRHPSAGPTNGANATNGSSGTNGSNGTTAPPTSAG